MRSDRRTRSRLLAGGAGILALLSGIASAQNSGARADDVRFEAGLLAYERNHWDEAYATFAALADGSDRESARIALLMLGHAKQLYGSAFSASADQAQRWSCVAVSVDDAATRACQVAMTEPAAHESQSARGAPVGHALAARR